MRIDSPIRMQTEDERKEVYRLRFETRARRTAIAFAFIAVFYFFIKLLFL